MCKDSRTAQDDDGVYRYRRYVCSCGNMLESIERISDWTEEGEWQAANRHFGPYGHPPVWQRRIAGEVEWEWIKEMDLPFSKMLLYHLRRDTNSIVKDGIEYRYAGKLKETSDV